MADDAQPNVLQPEGARRSTQVGDVPERLRRRYLTDRAGGPGLGFYADAAIVQAAFRDRGCSLATDRNEPNAIRDMAEIARHRGWQTVAVRGTQAFRQEAWLALRLQKLEVRGYTPNARDLQLLERRIATARRRDRPEADPPLPDRGARSRLRVVEQVVRARIADPSEQARLIAVGRERIARWLERGATFTPLRETDRAGPRQERGR